MDWSWLLYLMCPLMMLPMMFLMMKGSHKEESPNSQNKAVAEELAQLKKQNETMQKELRDLKRTV